MAASGTQPRIGTRVNTHNTFTPLCCDLDALSTLRHPDDAASSRSEIDQRKFELMCTRQKQAQILHESGGHRNARDTFRDLEAAGVPVRHLERDILAHKCKWCESNFGRKSYHCQKARRQGEDLEISTIIDPINPKTMLTETLAKIHKVTSAPDHPAWKDTDVIKGASVGPLTADTAKDVAKLQAFSQILQPDLRIPAEDEVSTCLPAGTDLRIDWAGAYSLGRHGERYFLLVVDKGTEYLANLNTKTRQSPVDLLGVCVLSLKPCLEPAS